MATIQYIYIYYVYFHICYRHIVFNTRTKNKHKWSISLISGFVSQFRAFKTLAYYFVSRQFYSRWPNVFFNELKFGIQADITNIKITFLSGTDPLIVYTKNY